MSNTDMRATRAVSRRTVAVGAAWIAPLAVVGVAAPAFAASPPCTLPFKLNWGTTSYTKSGNVGTATVAPSSGTGNNVVTTFTSTTTGSVTRDPTNLTIEPTTNIGGLGAGELAVQLHHTAPITAGRGNRQTVVISFSRAVTGLSFTITDIDSSRNNWWDRVELTGTRNGVSTSGHVVGSGTSGGDDNPWHYDDNDANVAITANTANLKVTYTVDVTSIQLDYWSTVGGGNQRIFLGDFTFTAAC